MSICAECGKTFSNVARHRRCNKCRRDGFSKTKPDIPCIICSVPIRQRSGATRPDTLKCVTCRQINATNNKLRKMLAEACRIPLGDRICIDCNSIFRQTNYRQKRCSTGCRSQVLALSRARNCKTCYTLLPETTGKKHRQYCGPSCQVKSPKGKKLVDNRNALKRGAYVADVYRAEIYRRDGWRCQICKLKVNPRYTGAHPKAPSLDHIIPLSLGGTHEPSNVQLAHFGCNARKGNRSANDQLLMFG